MLSCLPPRRRVLTACAIRVHWESKIGWISNPVRHRRCRYPRRRGTNSHPILIFDSSWIMTAARRVKTLREREDPMSDMARALVLYVDDDGANRRLMQRLFERNRAKHKLVTVGCGLEAIAVAQAQSPHLVLLDLNLPDMSGEEVLGALRQESSVPVVMLSGEADEVTRRRMLDLGANGYVTKPFDVADLFRVVDELIPEVREEVSQYGWVAANPAPN